MSVSDQTFEAPIDAKAALVEAPAKGRLVWDLPVRLFHWGLVVAIAGAFVTNRLGVAWFKYHVWCGYAVLTLALFRILWGFVGPRHARFGSFLRGPAATLRYAVGLSRGFHARYAGHNPLGGWMVAALLIALGVHAAAGLFGNDEIYNTGPLSGYVSKDVSLALTSLHRILFYWIAAAIGLHILAVVVHQMFDQPDLIRAMVTGRKSRAVVAEQEEIASSRCWLAALLVLAIAAALAWIVVHAPITLDDAF